MSNLREEIEIMISKYQQEIEPYGTSSFVTNEILKLIEKLIDEMIKEHTITSQDNETTLFYSGYRYGLQDFKEMLK